MERRTFLSTVAVGGLVAAGRLPLRAAEAPRIKIGQIGTGHAHADGKLAVLRRSPDFEIVGVVEPDERLRRAAAARRDYAGVKWLSESDLLATPGLRAVAVETEVKDLLPTAARCVAAGLHVHLDKPAGESLPEFARLLDAATRRGLTVQLGYMFRYNPAFEFCFRAVREGWLGRVFAIEAVIGKVVGPAEREKLRPYRGGAMFELGCHVIDAAVSVLGKPAKVTAQGRHHADWADGILDNQLATLEYPAALVTVRSSFVEVAGGSRRQFVVCGDAGTIDIRPLEPPTLLLALAKAGHGFKPGYQDVALPKRPRYEADLADLARVIRGEKSFAWSPAHDLAVQETVLRASGRPVG
jgi:predicted dehydrogenase